VRHGGKEQMAIIPSSSQKSLVVFVLHSTRNLVVRELSCCTGIATQFFQTQPRQKDKETQNELKSQTAVNCKHQSQYRYSA